MTRSLAIMPTVVLAISWAAAAPLEWTVIDDFDDTKPAAWAPEANQGEALRLTDERARSGAHCLKVTTAPLQGGKIIRATFGRPLSPWRLSLESRLRFGLYGDSSAHPTSSCIILIEAGGRKGGGDAHWVFTIPVELYAKERWQLVQFPPLREATQADWSVDIDGKLDPAQVSAVLFAVQRNADPADNKPFSLYLDDLEATHVTAEQERIVPALNTSEARQIRPTIRGFIDREREHAPQIVFDDLEGWRMKLVGGAQAELARSEEEPLLGKYSARLRYRGIGPTSVVEIVPPHPIELTDYFDTVDLWLFGNNWAWVPRADTPPVEVSIRLVDAAGQHHIVPVGRVNWRFWFLMHKRISWPPEWIQDRLKGRLPMRLASVRVTGITNSEDREIYLDSVALYEDAMELPVFGADLSDLPFPTRPDTILPDVKHAVNNSVRRDGTAFVLTAAGDERVQYRYEPIDGSLSSLQVTVGQGEPFKPMEGAGPVLRFGQRNYVLGSPAVNSELLAANVRNAAVHMRWRFRTVDGEAEYSVALQCKQKSLIITWDSKDPVTEFLSLGHIADGANVKLVHVPYLAFTTRDPWGVVCRDGAWVSVIPDWYVTNASEFGCVPDRRGEGIIQFAGDLRYGLKTDGLRNPAHERVFLTVSSDFDEIMPNIPNPGPALTDIVRTHLYTHYGGTQPDRFERWLDILKQYNSYGIDHLCVTHHEDTWTEGADVGQGPQEYTMTLDAAPDIGGDAKLKWYMDEVKRLGYRVGPYTNYADHSPSGKSWDERNIARLANGDWHPAWPQTWMIRPLKAVEMSQHYAPRIARKFGANTCYCDVHTALPLFGAIDHQAGAPGAATMSAVFSAYGKLLMQQREAYSGPVFSEGGFHWFYAGLIDGSYAQIRLPDRVKLPLMVDFDLRKIHPLSADISMLPGYIYDGTSLHQSLAATIAYGHIGYLPGGNVPHACKVYYMVQPLQQRYVHVPVDTIQYWDGDGWQTASTAYTCDAVHRSQVRIRYSNGLELHVNYNSAQDWEVSCGGESYALPPYGWVARQGDEFLEFSALVEGRRADYMRAPQMEYLDPFDRELTLGRITTDGPVAVRYDQAGQARVIPVIEGVSASVR